MSFYLTHDDIQIQSEKENFGPIGDMSILQYSSGFNKKCLMSNSEQSDSTGKC